MITHNEMYNELTEFEILVYKLRNRVSDISRVLYKDASSNYVEDLDEHRVRFNEILDELRFITE